MSFKAYPEYASSPIPWSNSSPKQWKQYPGLAIFREKLVKNIGLREKTVLSLSYGRIIVKSADKLRGLVPESFETYQIVEPGDMIIRSTDLQNDKTSLRVGKVRNNGIITSAYICLKPQPIIDNSFAYYLLHGLDLMKVFYGMGSGLRQNLSWSDFKRMPVNLPPLPEQTQIARFLDYKTAQINRFIKAKKRLIELLKEQKQAIINDAVTGKIDVTTGKPYEKYKDSGVEWLGKIPNEWEVKKGKAFFNEVDQRSVTGEEELLSVSHITGITPRKFKNITMFKSASYIGSKVCHPGQIAVNTMWAWMAALGVSKYHGVISPSYHTYSQKGRFFLDEYLDVLLRTSMYRSQYHLNSKGITDSRLRLYPESFLNIPFICPPLSDQESFLKWAKERTSRLDATMERTEREISLIQEYRTRLIADAVTGKIDVRDIEVPAFAEEDLLEPITEDSDEQVDELEEALEE